MEPTFKFKEGDVVRLKSGGEKMTVRQNIVRNTGASINAVMKTFAKRTTNYPENDVIKVVCAWFENKKMRTGEFDEELLDFAN